MPVRRSGVGMGVLGARLARLANKSWQLGLHQNLAQECRRLLYDGFRQERDPYGRAWAPTLRGGKILQQTRRLLNSLAPVATSAGINIATAVVYAAAHQYGALIRATEAAYLRFQVNGQWASKKEVEIPRRQFLPTRETGGLGPIWSPAFRRVINRFMALTMGARLRSR